MPPARSGFQLISRFALGAPLPRTVVLLVTLALTAFMVRTYARFYQPAFGWTRLIAFGASFEPRSLPELQRTPHYISKRSGQSGYDGQFYAQLALDPALENPALTGALDSPVYRARRIGMPALAFWLGWGKPWWVLQAFALANLFFWLLLLAVLLRLLWPCTGRGILCLGGAMLGFGVIESVRRALIDLPAASLLFAGCSFIGTAGGTALLAMALLTRETCFLAIAGTVDFTGSPRRWLLRQGVRLAVASVPFTLWLVYVHYRLHGWEASGADNFAPPFTAFATRAATAIRGVAAEPLPMSRWLALFYRNHRFHELLGLSSLFVQCVYLAVRPEPKSVFWRIGALYVVLCFCLGSAVWDGTGAAARVLLPLTISFYLQLAHEPRAWVFWLFFVLSILAIPYGVCEFWKLHAGG